MEGVGIPMVVSLNAPRVLGDGTWGGGGASPEVSSKQRGSVAT